MNSHPEFFWQQLRKMSLKEKKQQKQQQQEWQKEMSSSKSAKPVTSYFQKKKEK